ncbi:MAG: aminodeoxychorismate synthase component I [Bacteroidota bacterium]
MRSKSEAISFINQLGKDKKRFSFYCDFLGEKWVIQENTDQPSFYLDIQDSSPSLPAGKIEFERYPISLEGYQSSFEKVVHQINVGNSFLTNLTFPTRIETNLGLDEVFRLSKARYKLLVPHQFVVFSPETFVQIRNGRIYSHPMKGTIDARLPDAKAVILNDEKETAEHVTIVDLIRNDLSQVATNIQVTQFRYVDEIQTNKKTLLQVSSEIQGELPNGWNEHLGSILRKLLPAGSISGAPKPQTLQIIRSVEKYDRNFYTGICGRFDGESLDTGVMIRFVQKKGNDFYYYSGGGITSFSKLEKEYSEMVDKVYLPI